MSGVKVVISVKEKPLKDGTGSLFLDLRIDGKRTRERLSLYTSGNKRKTNDDKEAWALAEKIKSKRVIEIAEVGQGFNKNKSTKECFVKYFTYYTLEEEKRYKKNETSSKTYQTYKAVLIHLNDFTKGSVRFASIDAIWLENFKTFIQKAVPSPRTQSTYFSKIRAMINKAYREHKILFNPVSSVKHIVKGESEKVYLLEEEIEKLIKTPCKNEEWKIAFLFSCFTGLRLSDVLALTWDKVQGKTLHFRQQKTGGFEYLPLSETAINILKAIPKTEDNKVFHLSANSRRSEYIYQWAKDSGVNKKITFHSSRHTFATLLLTKGVDLYTVSKLLGHQDIATTLIYAKIIDKVKDNAVDSLPKLEVNL